MAFQQANISVAMQSHNFADGLLLGRQMAGPFKGYLMCPGGKNKPNENPFTAAVRELREETSLEAYERNLQHVGIIQSHFDGMPAFEVDVFRVLRHGGVRRSTPGFPNDWWPTARLPWNDMLRTDLHWLWFAIVNKWFGRLIVQFGPTPNIIDKITIEPNFEKRLRPP